jgi:hypothetical protein
MGGDLVAIQTDCVICEVARCEVEDTDGAIKFSRYGFDTSPIGGVKLAENKQVSMEIIPKKNDERRDMVLRNTWEEVEETDFKTDDQSDHFPQMAAHRVLALDQSLSVTGKGGSGKSSFIVALTDQMKKAGKTYQLLAPTNIAARHDIGGMTIHKFMGINDTHQDEGKMSMKISNFDYIIVDEDSMMGYTFLTLFQRAKMNSKKTIFIFLGDFRQLPPVSEERNSLGEDLDYHNSYVKMYMCDFNCLKLTINKRSNDTMWELADAAYEKGIVDWKDYGDFDVFDAHIHVCFTNRKRKEINDIRYEKEGSPLQHHFYKHRRRRPEKEPFGPICTTGPWCSDNGR